MREDHIAKSLPGTRRTLKANTPVLYQGEVPRNGFYILSGVVKAYTLQRSGDEQIVSFFGPGDFFPLPWLCKKSSNSIFYHETLDMCSVINVTRDDIQHHVLYQSENKDRLLDKLVEDQAGYLMRITALEQPRAAEKILFTLYYLLYTFGKPTKNSTNEGIYRIDLKLTHAIIASLVGMTRETTATELNKIKKKGIIEYRKKIYTVNKSKLEKALGEDAFTELVT